MKRIMVMVAAVLLQTGAYAQPATPPGPVEHASADDCAVIVEVGKAKMHWGTTASDYAFYSTFDLPGGGTYHEDCPWKALGVAEPMIGTPDSSQGFYISRPAYEGSRATVDLEWFIRPPREKNIAPFIERDKCSVKKRDGRWHFVACELRLIT